MSKLDSIAFNRTIVELKLQLCLVIGSKRVIPLIEPLWN